MSHGYRAVAWTPHKKVYDAVLAGGVVLYLGLFVGHRPRPRRQRDDRDAAHPRSRDLRAAPAARHPRDRPAGAPRSALPAAALQPPPSRRDDVPARARARGVRHRAVPCARKRQPAGQRSGFQHALRQREPVPVRGAGAGRSPHPVPDGRHQPRLLARQPHRAGVEVASHAGLPGVRADRPPRRARRAPGGEISRCWPGSLAAGLVTLVALHVVAGQRERARRSRAATAARMPRASSRSAGSATSARSGRASSRSAASGSRSSATTARSRRSRTSASTRTVRSAKGRSSTAASLVPGTAISTCRRPALRRRRSPRACRRSACDSTATGCWSIRGRSRPEHGSSRRDAEGHWSPRLRRRERRPLHRLPAGGTAARRAVRPPVGAHAPGRLHRRGRPARGAPGPVRPGHLRVRRHARSRGHDLRAPLPDVGREGREAGRVARTRGKARRGARCRGARGPPGPLRSDPRREPARKPARAGARHARARRARPSLSRRRPNHSGGSS